MVRMPVRFRRMAEAFEEVAKARRCGSSGSEPLPESLTDLSDLVNSFIEEVGENEELNCRKREGKMSLADSDHESYCSDSEMKDFLKNLLGFEDDDDDVRRKIYVEAKQAWRVIGDSTSPEFKWRLISRLRETGFDAGLCKSKWQRNGPIPSGQYEYIDVNVAGTRYVIEVSLAGEFEIARPTHRYTSLLKNFPPIFVGKAEELDQLVRLMCNAIKKSMKSMDMPVPPWRRHGYVQAKWFGSYKRSTINELPGKKAMGSDEDSGKKRSVGFVPLPGRTYYCREDFASKVGLKVGNLAMAINGTSMLL